MHLAQLINKELFKNLNNNIDNMPKIKKIYLYFTTNIDRATYEEFIRKLLSLKLEYIHIDISFNDRHVNYDDYDDYNDDYNEDNEDDDYNDKNDEKYYSFEELKIINKSILYLNFENIKIKKYTDNK